MSELPKTVLLRIVVVSVVLMLMAAAYLLLVVDQRDIPLESVDAVSIQNNRLLDRVPDRAQDSAVIEARQGDVRSDRARARADALSQIMQTWPTAIAEVSPAQQQAISAQVELTFGEFLAELSGSDVRREAVKLRLEQALSEIAAIAAARQSDLLSTADLDVLTDPNHVLNRAGEILDPFEITELDNQMRSTVEREFLQNFEPQIDAIVPEMTYASRDLLLDTWFAENYALTSPYGIGEQTGVGANLEQQLVAIRNTQDSLRRAMTPEQFQLADKFLVQQSQALDTARTIFSGVR